MRVLLVLLLFLVPKYNKRVEVWWVGQMCTHVGAAYALSPRVWEDRDPWTASPGRPAQKRRRQSWRYRAGVVYNVGRTNMFSALYDRFPQVALPCWEWHCAAKS